MSKGFMGAIAAWWCRWSSSRRSDDGGHPNADELRQIQRQIRRREVRAMLEASLA